MWNFSYYDYKLINKDEEYGLNIIREYNKGGAAPIGMDAELAKKLGYGSIHTYESANANKEVGDIKLK